MFHRPEDFEPGDSLDCDICIVGAGAAGITLALEFAESRHQVLLIEAGGFDPPEITTTHPYHGTISGIPYSLLGSRLRYFGGTTNHWGGWCRPLDPLDFKVRSYVSFSGWPLAYPDLLPFYRRAQELCEIEPPGFGLGAAAESPGTREEFFHSYDPQLTIKNFRFSPPTRFGETYRPALGGAGNIRCLLETSVVEIEARRQAVVALHLRAGEKRFRVQAHNYILAMGAIENARLLLHSNKGLRRGLGNEGRCVGRFFGDHIGKTIGQILTSTESPYTRRNDRGVAVLPHLSFSEEYLQKESLLNFGIVFLASSEQLLLGRHYLDNEQLFPGWEGHRERQGYQVVVRLETAPNPESRLRLTRQQDPNGVRRVDLDWKLSGLEEYCLNRVADLIGRKVGLHAMGRFRRSFYGGSDFREGDFSTQAHHLGTTRMSHSPESGVVDSDCRVHGMENLFIAGSSVFPTFGFANPTLTIVALAARLAAHLKQKNES